MSPSPVVHFAGPDYPRGHLRDLLEERVDAVPAGGAIDWVTYYFRDRRLAEALVRARRRGVAVGVAVDGRPRTSHANDEVAATLEAALGAELRRVLHPGVRLPGRPVRHPHLHEKLYCFSHPRPTAFVGSFNPSGDGIDDDPEMLEEIRDQDAGHNLLVELAAPAVAEALAAHAREIRSMHHGLLERFSPRRQRSVTAPNLRIDFWPRAFRNPVLVLLRGVAPGASVRIAASHLKGGTMHRALARLARHGTSVTILTEETRRRVPDAVFRALSALSVSIERVRHPDGFPMHDKFMLIESGSERVVVFGSFNWTERSFRLNHEISVVCRDPSVFAAFSDRWKALAELSGGSVVAAV